LPVISSKVVTECAEIDDIAKRSPIFGRVLDRLASNEALNNIRKMIPTL
jgi:hypothetical protein